MSAFHPAREGDRERGLPRSVKRVALAAILALNATLLFIAYLPQLRGLVGDENNYLIAAQAIEAGEQVEDPLRPPLYPKLLALLEVSETQRTVVILAQIALLFLTAFILRDLATRFFHSRRAGDLAAVVTLLYPTLIAYSHFLWPEIVHIALWLGSLWVLSTRKRTPGWLVLAGAFLAVACLTRYLLLPFIPVVLAVVWLDSDSHRIRRIAWMLLPLLVLLLPGMIVDLADDGRLRSGSSARFNLWVGLKDTSRSSFERPLVYRQYRRYMKSGDTAAERDEVLHQKISALVAERGVAATTRGQLEKQYFRLFEARNEFTEQLPGGALAILGRGYQGMPSGLSSFLRGLDYAVYTLILIAAAWGLATVPVGRSRWLTLILLFLLFNLLLFFGVHAKARYRMQMMPFLILFAAYGIDHWIGLARRAMSSPQPTRGRVLAAVAAASLLLFLAFGGGWLS